MNLNKFSKDSNSLVKKYFSNHVIRKVIIPFILLLIALLFSTFSSLTYNSSYTVLPHEHTDTYEISPREGELYAGQTIKGTFQAKENNLGALAVRIHNFNNSSDNYGGDRIDEDEILFRIKESSSSNWYYEQKYNGGQFHELVHFPFGFNPIAESKNKDYYYEIISLNGSKGNVLTLTDKEPIIITNYQFSKNELLGNNAVLISFILQKVLYAFSHIDFYFIVFIFLLPFILYVILITLLGNILVGPIRYVSKKFSRVLNHHLGSSQLGQYLEKISIFDVLVFIGFLIDIIIIGYTNSLITSTLLLLWLFNCILQKNDSTASFSSALIIILLCPIFYTLSYPAMAEKAGVWVMLLLIVGATQLATDANYQKI